MLKVTKKLWNIIKELGSSKECKLKIAKIGLKIRDTISFDKLEVAPHFNQKNIKPLLTS